MTDERGRWLLGPKQDACNERRITAVIGNERMNLVIDRTFRGADNKRWIVDYKTSSHEGADTEAFLDRERALPGPACPLCQPLETRASGLYFPLLHVER